MPRCSEHTLNLRPAQACDRHDRETSVAASQQNGLQETAGFEHDEIARLPTAGILIVELDVGAAEVGREHKY